MSRYIREDIDVLHEVAHILALILFQEFHCGVDLGIIDESTYKY